MKTLDKVANQTVTAEDVEKLVKRNQDNAVGNPFGNIQHPERDIAFSEEVAYDPRLIGAGVVYGD